jgi:MFS family permease
VLLASAAALFFGGVFNVAELLLASRVLGGGDTGYSILVGIYGAGFIAGSLSGAKGGETGRLRQWYLAGLLLMALGFGVSGLAPNIAFAAGTFVVAGLGNGMMLVYERLLIQKLVPDTVAGRVFGLKDALTAWAFALAFLSGPGIVAMLGTRGTLLLVGAGGLVVWAVALGVVLRQVAGSRQTGAAGRAIADAPFSRPL